ncbi:7892_t:CDS:10 [Gigaspora margarita]|uniref:7892_t:CDS:1 n=1 Tax=Gigaspora margarita TaxID=4874 RepID=A0ABN7UH00_GIGMA|nr:7892_t:CDS:10 [Gigaspora margarita]
MLNFSTKIHKDNLLAKTARTNILKEQPRNAEIKYEAPTMDKRIWKLMSPQAKETDKLLSKIAYRSSATLPWHYVETSLKDTRALLLDTLSYINDLRRQQSLKVILPNYTPPSGKEEVFGDDLEPIIEKENSTNKLFDKAAESRKKQQHNYKESSYKPSYVKRKRVLGRPQLHGSPKTIQQPKLDDKLRREQTPVAERLLSHLINWTKLTGPSWHTYIIKEGYCPEWIVTPLNYYSPDLHHVVAPDLSGEIQNLLEKRNFTIPKKDGTSRLIIDLRELNSYIHATHFKMERRSYDNDQYSRRFLPRSLIFINVGNHRVVKEPSYQTHDILGRHSLTSTLKFRGDKSDKNYCTETRRAWFQNQLTKVYASPFPTSRILGLQDRFKKNGANSSTKENKRPKKRMFHDYKATTNTYKEISINHWKALSYYWCSTSIETHDTLANKRQKLSSKKAWMECTTDTIAPKHPATQLDGSSKKSRDNLWTLDRSPKKITHKYSRIEGNSLCTAIVQGYQQSNSLGKIRQYSSGLPKPPRRITAQHLPGELNLQADQASRYKPVQQDWKLNSTICNQLMIKWGPFTIDLFANRNNTQLSHYFSRFLDPSALTTDALKQDWPKETLWANPPWIIIPKILSKMILDKHPGFPTNECPNRLPNITTNTQNTDSIANQSTQFTSKPKMENVHLLDIRAKLQAKNFPEEAIKKIQNATNKSSNATIGSAINNSVFGGPLENVIKFLSDMNNQQRAFNTLASYRTAISKVHKHIDGYPVGRHPEVAKFMIAIQKTNPPSPSLDEAIDILPSLDFIISLGSNDSMSMLDLSRKAAFLTALETLFEIINPKEVNISIAHGNNKHRTKKVFINFYEDQCLCPATMVLKLLERTQEWKNTTELQDHLFLTTAIPHHLASVDTISRWIKNILTKADSTARAKDIRALSALLAQDAGADINTLLALENWSNHTVYQRFYQRGIKKILK